MAEFMMWQTSALFENIGTIQDGMKTLGKPIHIQDSPNALPLNIDQGGISFDQVTFAYNDKKVIDQLNLDIKPGEKIGIVGRSGAGKSTLMKILTGVYTKDAGQVIVDGKEVCYNNPQEAEKAGIVFKADIN